ADLERRVVLEHDHRRLIAVEAAGDHRSLRAVDRDVVLAGDPLRAVDVVGVLVGDDDGGDALDGEAEEGQPFFRLPRTESGVDQDGGAVALEIKAIAGASGSERGDEHAHDGSIARAMPMERFVVEGGRRLDGTIRPGGNKNAALPILAACLLTDEAITLRNLPDIQDVRVMLEILEGLGASVERLERNVVRVHAKGECGTTPDPALSKKIRASILLAGPLLARVGSAFIAKPGGDAIGRRRVDT